MWRYIFSQFALVETLDLYPTFALLAKITDLRINDTRGNTVLPLSWPSKPLPVTELPPSAPLALINDLKALNAQKVCSSQIDLPVIFKSALDPLIRPSETLVLPAFMSHTSTLFRFACGSEKLRQQCPKEHRNIDIGVWIADQLDQQLSVVLPYLTAVFRDRLVEVLTIKRFRHEYATEDIRIHLLSSHPANQGPHRVSSAHFDYQIGRFARTEQVGDSTFVRLAPGDLNHETESSTPIVCGGDSATSTIGWWPEGGPHRQLRFEGSDCAHLRCAPGCVYEETHSSSSFRPARPGFFSVANCKESQCPNFDNVQFVREGMKSGSECFDPDNFICLGHQRYWEESSSRCLFVPQGWEGRDCGNAKRLCPAKPAETLTSVFELGRCTLRQLVAAEAVVADKITVSKLNRASPFLLKFRIVLETPIFAVEEHTFILLGLFPLFFVSIEANSVLHYTSARHGDFQFRLPTQLEQNRIYSFAIVFDSDALFVRMDNFGLIGISPIHPAIDMPTSHLTAEDKIHLGPYAAEPALIEGLIEKHGYSQAWRTLNSPLKTNIAVAIDACEAGDLPGSFWDELVVKDAEYTRDMQRQSLLTWPYAPHQVNAGKTKVNHGARVWSFFIGMLGSMAFLLCGKKAIAVTSNIIRSVGQARPRPRTTSAVPRIAAIATAAPVTHVPPAGRRLSPVHIDPNQRPIPVHDL